MIDRGGLGGIAPLDGGRLTILDVSHRVLKVDIQEDGSVTVEIEVLDTEKGKALKELLANGVSMMAGPCGVGTVDDNGVVSDDYIMESFDVTKPK